MIYLNTIIFDICHGYKIIEHPLWLGNRNSPIPLIFYSKFIGLKYYKSVEPLAFIKYLSVCCAP